MSKKSFRVYWITHHNNHRTGMLMRSWSSFWDSPPPSSYGFNEEEVLMQLELLLQEEEMYGRSLERYLWEERFAAREVSVQIHPQTVIEKRPVVGKKHIPLRLTYAYSKTKAESFRIMLPRFGWRFLVEDLEIVPEVLRNALSTVLLGENPRWVYDFRREGAEYVTDWTPRFHPKALAHEQERDARPAPETVSKVAEDWVERATKHKLPPVIGDVEHIDQALAWSRRAPPASILLVGGPGIGKTTFVRRMAQRFASLRKDKTQPQQPRIWASSGERIIAGQVYLGMWQKRCLQLIEELSSEGDYFYIDRLTSIIRPQPDGSSIADILLPAVASEEISLIAECSEAELERCQRKAPQLMQHFQLLRLQETPTYQMPELLSAYQGKKNIPVSVHPAGLRRLVSHLDMFQRDLCFPGKGFRFIDWLGQESNNDRSKILYAKEASEAYSRYSGLPLALISDDFPATSKEISLQLARAVIGQNEACYICAKVLARFKAGLNDPEKPCGSLFFVGPTGVGKTELAKQLARYMFGSDERLIRLDMSEYMMPGAAQRWLEVGEGVTSLAQQVRQQPLSLILLDEIEKAHSQVFDLLLGILGEGRLTDAFGRLVDFRMTMVIMTSNLGISEAPSVGFGEKENTRMMQTVRQHFRPEFFNRIDHVITFGNLTQNNVLQIVDLELAKASARTGLKRRNLKLEVSSEAKAFLAKIGYHPTRGARPLRRVLEERVVTPVAVRMSQDPELRDRTIRVLHQNEPAFLSLSEKDREPIIILQA
jgi:ATP-dependent Clp protease ATP-binding subunit ClpC